MKLKNKIQLTLHRFEVWKRKNFRVCGKCKAVYRFGKEPCDCKFGTYNLDYVTDSKLEYLVAILKGTIK